MNHNDNDIIEIETPRPLRDYSEEFTLFRPNGKPVDPVVARVQTIWIDASSNNYTVLVRPAGWIKLSDAAAATVENCEDSIGGSLTPRSIDESVIH